MQHSELVKVFLEHNQIPEEEWESHLRQEIIQPEFPVIKKAKEIQDLFKETLKNQDRVMLSADYDSDGTTAAIVMYKYLKHAGFNLDKDTLYIPTRDQGYGMSAYAIKKAIKNRNIRILHKLNRY